MRLRALCVLGAALVAPGCTAAGYALLSTAGGVLAQALHLDAALVELWTTDKQQKAGAAALPESAAAPVSLPEPKS